MHNIRLEAPAGRVSEELVRRGIPADTPVSVLVEIRETVELPLAALLQEGGAFNFLAEEPDIYTDADVVERNGQVFEFGAIVLARFPFTDLSGDKRRPALIVSRDNARRSDVVVCFITSVARSGPDMAPIEAGAETGLKVPSVVRFDKLATLEKPVITGKLGVASKAWLAAQRDTFFGVFGFDLR